MAFPGTYNFSYYRGDTFQFVARPKNSNDNSSFALNGFSGIFTIANQRGAVATQYEADVVINTTTNIVTCTISPSVGRSLSAGTYVYDVQIDNGIQVYTLLTGSITVVDDVTGAV
jgi:hypothetical protein